MGRHPGIVAFGLLFAGMSCGGSETTSGEPRVVAGPECREAHAQMTASYTGAPALRRGHLLSSLSVCRTAAAWKDGASLGLEASGGVRSAWIRTIEDFTGSEFGVPLYGGEVPSGTASRMLESVCRESAVQDSAVCQDLAAQR